MNAIKKRFHSRKRFISYSGYITQVYQPLNDSSFFLLLDGSDRTDDK